jgi:Domain of unknown function (DUF1772)
MGRSETRSTRRGLAVAAENGLLQSFLAVTGLALGAGLFELRVIIPQWAGKRTGKEIADAMEQSGHAISGKKFWALVGPLVLPLTAANLAAALRSSGARRRWWLGSSATMAGIAVATATYYVPTLHKLQEVGAIPDTEVEAVAKQRVRLDYVRVVVGVAAWFAGLRALSK